MKSSEATPLIADSDAEYLLSLKLDPKAKHLPPVTACNMFETAKLLSSPGGNYSAIFLNPEMNEASVEDILQKASARFPNAPIFFLTSKNNLQISGSTSNAQIVRKIVRKPISYTEILKTITLYSNIFDPEAALAVAQQNKDAIGAIVTAQKAEFYPIKAAQFISGSIALFDVYAQTSSNEYSKILQAGTNSAASNISDYIKKGTRLFFVRRAALEHYVKYCDRLGAVLSRKPGLPDTTKLNFILNQGEEVLRYLKLEGLSSHGINYARRFVETAKDFSRRIITWSPSEIHQLFYMTSDHEHEALAVIAGMLLIQKMRFQSEKSYEVVGLAALLHDIALDDSMSGLNDEKIASFGPKDLEIYHGHPILGAKMLSAFSELDPSIAQAIEQHHERSGHSGFPHQLGSKFISGVSEIVAISDEFSKFVKFDVEGLTIKAFVREKLETRFSSAIINAFKELFVRRDDGTIKI